MAQELHPTTAATSTGLAPNLSAILAYVFGFVGGIVFLLIEKNSQYVRFHAAQSIVFSVALVAANIALSILGAMLGRVPGVGLVVGLASFAIGIGGLVAWIMLIIKAANGQEYEAPVIAPYARRIQGSING